MEYERKVEALHSHATYLSNMSSIPDDLKYTAEHEWIRKEVGVAVVGINDYAQNALHDIVSIEFLAEEGDAGED